MFKIVESYKFIEGFFKVELYPIDEEDIYYYTQLSIEFRDIKDMEMPIMLNILTEKTSKEVIIDYVHVNSAINKAIKELELTQEFEKCLVLKNIQDKFNKEINNDYKQRVCIQSC